MAAVQGAGSLGYEGSLQDTKEAVTYYASFLSISAGLSYDNNRLVRNSTFSLVSGETNLYVVEELLEDAEPGSFRETILLRRQQQYLTQVDAAQAHLDALDEITQVGAVLDGLLLASGSGLVINLIRKAVLRAGTKSSVGS